ncbi:MAG: tetratricopeptide repeat protein [Balneolaceae bacterium]|nr:tetratricopeptide repeat protein [Balneolaceae bacterium]
MSKRLTKEQLESDPLADSYEKVQYFYQQNKAAVIGGIIAFLLIVGGGVGYYFYHQSQERQAANLMTNAETAFLQGNYQVALTGSEAQFTVGFEQIINNYGGTDAGNLARYYAAVCHFNMGNYQQALSNIQRFEVPEGIMGVSPLSFHAVILTELGNHSEAADIYVRAAEWEVNSSTTPYNYMEAAHAYRDAGNTEQARRYAQMIIDEYPESSQVAQAERFLGMLAADG